MLRRRLLAAFLIGLAVDAGTAALAFIASGFQPMWLLAGWVFGWLPGLFYGTLYLALPRPPKEGPDDDPD